MNCYWPEVIGICGETFYGLLMAGGAVGVAVTLGAIFAMAWSFVPIVKAWKDRGGIIEPL